MDEAQLNKELTKAQKRVAELEESEQQFRILFEKSADASLLIKNGEFVDCNQATVNMLRAENKEQVLNTHPSQLSPDFQPDGRASNEKADEMMSIALAKGTNRFEWVHRRVDGTDFFVEVSLTSITIDKDQWIHTVWRDLSDSKRSEAQLLQSEQRFRTLFEKSGDPSLLIKNGEFVDCNQATVDILRAENKEQVLNTHPSQLSPDHQPDGRASAEKADEMIAIALEKGSHRFEWVHRRMDNEDFFVEVSLTTIPLGDDLWIYTVWRDLSERKRAEAERLELQQQIIEAQKQALRDLSTPIIPLMEEIIIIPLVGNIDSSRAYDIMRSMLSGITKHRAKIVIIDITGVAIVDTGVANHLDKAMQAARLKGARTIVTGISDAVAETIVDLGIDWSDVETLRDLQTGLLTALRQIGLHLERHS